MKKLIVLVFLLCIIFLDVNVVYGKETLFSYDFKKASANLQEMVVKDKDSEKDYYIMIQLYDDIDMQVESARDSFSNNIEENKSILKEYRENIKSQYINHNTIKILTKDLRGINIDFTSQYSSFVFAYADIAEIIKLDKSKDVEMIYILDDSDLVGQDTFYEDTTDASSNSIVINDEYDETTEYLPTTGIDAVKSTYPTLDGTGITIGIYEYSEPGDSRCGIDGSNIEFSGVTIIDNVTCTNPEIHGTTVAMIAVGRVNGIADNANIVYTESSSANSIPINFEDLIDEGVDIINSSWEYTYNVADNHYDILSAYIDEVIRNTGVVWVTAAGNDNQYMDENYDNEYTDLLIGPMAMSKNIITVGATYSQGNEYSRYSKFQYNYLGYENLDEDDVRDMTILDYIKPNIVAPGGCGYYVETGQFLWIHYYDIYYEGLNVPNSEYMNSGTPIIGSSFAAPQVAGAIALLMQYDNSLIGNPTKVMALLEASANASEISDVVLDSASGRNSMVGAGLMDVQKAIDILNQDNSSFSYTTGNASYRVVQIEVSAGDTLTITNAYLKNEIYDGSTMLENDISDYKDFDIRITNSNYSIIAQTTTDFSNSEIIMVNCYVDDVWTITITRRYHDLEEIEPDVDLIAILGTLIISSQLGVTIHHTYSGC